MKKFNVFFLAMLVVGIAVLTQCSTTEKNAGITPPLDGVNVAFNDFSIDPTTGAEFKLETGTKITVPADAFVDADGNPITSKINLKYREFHSLADILASGIPMQFKGENGVENFESAGMFEIRGYADGKPVFVKDGKDLTVDMGSYKDGKGYGFYYFDETTNTWLETGPANVRDNPSKKAKLAALGKKPTKPFMPKKADKNTAVINLQVNYANYPELATFNGVMWQYAGDDPEKDPANNNWLMQNSWTDVNLTVLNEDQGLYNLKLRSGGQNFETVVSPVLNGKNHTEAKAKFSQKMKEYKKAYSDRVVEENRLNVEADLLRTFKVNNFGIFNCDCFYSDPMAVVLNANFDFEEKDVNTKNMTIFLIPKKKSAVVQYRGKNAWKAFRLNPENPNTLIAVLPGNKVAYCKPGDISDKLKSKANGAGEIDYTFKMKTRKGRVGDMNSLEELLSEL